MISRNWLAILALPLLCALLTGCPGTDDNYSESGLTVHMAEIHFEEDMAPAAVSATSSVSSAAVGGYDDSTLGHHTLSDGAGHSIAVYRAYIVLDELNLIPCFDLASVPAQLLRGIIPSAHAHAGHGSEPVGGRALDQPNVIDLMTQDGFHLALGDLAVAPGRYCGLEVTLGRLGGSGYGVPEPAPASNDDPVSEPEVPALSGLMLSFTTDYCDEAEGSECLHRTPINFNDRGELSPLRIELDFTSPLIINAQLREGFVVLGIGYADWFSNLDLTQIHDDPEVLQTLLQNIADSLYVYNKGLGDIPINASE